MSKDYYKILGISKSATADEIKKAYRKLALEHHPDTGGQSDEKFKEINEAYQILSDPQKRQRYDQFGDAAFKGAGGSGSSGFSGFEGFDFSNFGGNRSSGFGFNGGFGDLFEDFFGAAFSQVQAEIAITPAQAVLGDKLSFEIEKQKIELNLPAGTQDGVSFRFPGKGRAYNNGRRGDLILTVRIEMPKHLTKEQKELWEKLKETEQKRKWWSV